MIARSFKSVGWVAGIGGAALGCYMLSLQVAAERAELSNVEARIVRAREAIRDLQTELGTRGRLSQLEHWNAEVLALAAPAAGQFVENEVVLARLETRSGELAGGAPVQPASAETTTAAPAAPAPAQVRTAAATSPSTPTPSAAPVVRRATLAETPAAPAAARAAAPRVAPAVVQARSETRPAAARSPAPARTAALLDARTARELGETARAERGEGSPARAAPRPGADRTASRD